MPMPRQIEWGLKNGPITENGVLPVTNLISWKFCFSIRTSSRELIWCTNYSKVHSCTFRKCSSFLWQRLPANTPRVFLVEATWKWPFPCHFNVERTWCVCKIFLCEYPSPNYSIIKANWFYTKKQNCELQREVLVNRNSNQSKTCSKFDNSIIPYNRSNQSDINITQ